MVNPRKSDETKLQMTTEPSGGEAPTPTTGSSALLCSGRTLSLDQSQGAAAAPGSSGAASAIHQGRTVALARNTGGRGNNSIQFITVSIISRAGRLIFHVQPGQFTQVHILATGPFFFVFFGLKPCHRTRAHYLSSTPHCPPPPTPPLSHSPGRIFFLKKPIFFGAL